MLRASRTGSVPLAFAEPGGFDAFLEASTSRVAIEPILPVSESRSRHGTVQRGVLTIPRA